jgi:hypothetical protein
MPIAQAPRASPRTAEELTGRGSVGGGGRARGARDTHTRAHRERERVYLSLSFGRSLGACARACGRARKEGSLSARALTAADTTEGAAETLVGGSSCTAARE